MITEVVSNSYADGKRISTQKVTYDKSDDLYTLANLQRRHEHTCELLANPPSGYTEKNIEHLEAEKASLEAEIAAQEAIINGYTSAE